jgi:voltage-gated potassium channel Kch
MPVGGVARAFVARTGDTLVVNGWATVGAKAAGAIVAVVDGSSAYVAAVDLDRPDVARVLRNDGYAKSGFSVAVPTADLLPGVHHVTFRIVTPDLAGYYDAAIGLTLSVTPAATS